MVVSIRRAQFADIRFCVDILAKFFEEDRGDTSYKNKQGNATYNKEKLYKYLLANVKNEDFLLNLLIQDNKIIGGVCAYIASPIYSYDRIAYDQILYISPEHANLKYLFRLIKTYMTWAKQKEVIEVRLCTSTGYNIEGFTKLCLKFGLEPFELGFSKGLK